MRRNTNREFKMLIIGHRGAAGHANENTIKSIRKALEIRVDAIEIDLQETSDGAIILHHDRTIIDNKGTDFFIKDLSLTTINEIFMSKTQENVTFLDEACNETKGKCTLIIELKFNPSLKKVINIVEKKLSHNEFIIASFDHSEILAIKSINKNIKTMALIEGFPANLLESLKECKCDFIGLGFKSVSEKHVQYLKKSKIPIIAWTIDSEKEAMLALSMGFNGIISNFPDIVKMGLNKELNNPTSNQ